MSGLPVLTHGGHDCRLHTDQASRKAHRECRTFETTTFGLEALLTWLSESACAQVAIEATGVYRQPVWNILSDGRFELMLADAAHIKNVPGRKADMNDAMWSADLLSCGRARRALFLNRRSSNCGRRCVRSQRYARADRPTA